ncbi:hypothetical protein ASPTUDRAFT_494986 [Aspergillus tubingensis CBS 134.48]|uniref:Uncharacterized protein n=1 Tax=Aspergillus tubingensis (strain CBS 134.48) TaxID=767770 RepID=A0A1L9NC43_ASPTC|nr:hypothetical protein ASPTUDRAFT_494986 [Aspergillus tubingensis CBS 134.48]
MSDFISGGAALLTVSLSSNYHFMIGTATLRIWSQNLLLLLVILILWRKCLWPNYFSLLRHLPSPHSGTWGMTQCLRLYTKPRGKPQCDWVNHIPNDGLIRYRTLLNSD